MKEVIILGKAPSGASCPFDAEVWGINDVCTFPEFKGKHFNKIIFTDPMSEGLQRRVAAVKSLNIPIISLFDYGDERYPLVEIIRGFNTMYLCNTVSRAIALALYLGYGKIRLYGIDHKLPQHRSMRGTVEYWIGRAHERGVIVDIQEESNLLKQVW